MKKNLKENIIYPKEGIYSTVFAKGKANYTLMCLAKGSDIEEHTSTKEAGILVLDGEGTFILEGEEIEMREGVFIQMAPDAKHSVKARENLALVLILA